MIDNYRYKYASYGYINTRIDPLEKAFNFTDNKYLSVVNFSPNPYIMITYNTIYISVMALCDKAYHIKTPNITEWLAHNLKTR